jgi:hypothetical protein
MNKDFHYGAIYIIARFAGMPAADAVVIAHACQYVDDATTDGPLQFRDQQSFDRFASAHAMLDYRNESQAKDERVWAPFHFLPAAQGATVDEKLVCRPDSAPARELVRHTLGLPMAAPADNDLHRLGVCLHTYVDTWAHQGFSGIMSNRNHVKALTGTHHPTSQHWLDDLRQCASGLADEIKSDAVDWLSNVGHGAALHYPDRAWVGWTYTNGVDETVTRDNLPDFLTAADMACRAIRAFLAGTDQFEGQPGLTLAQRGALEQLLGANIDEDEDKRLTFIAAQLESAGVGDIHEPLPGYVGKGEGSWKYLATGIDADDDGALLPEQRPIRNDTFEQSDYRKVHDAIKQHRHFVTEVLLLAHGLRLA